MKALRDHRCPGLPDMPYSSYCKVCWYPVYTLWIDRDDHGGRCMHGCSSATECVEAASRARSAAALTAMRERLPG
uniref:Uncharacterized protein n=1 Tax=Xanthomonas vasicola pv. vasculorum NCPPB 890 TaxID=1184265 RepID=A0A837ANX5_XANVA